MKESATWLESASALQDQKVVIKALVSNIYLWDLYADRIPMPPLTINSEGGVENGISFNRYSFMYSQ